MSYQLLYKTDAVEAVIDDNCGMKKFNNITNLLIKDLKVKFLNKNDDSDSVDWHFKYKGHPLTLHFNIFNGLSVSTEKRRDNSVVQEIAMFVLRKAS